MKYFFCCTIERENEREEKRREEKRREEKRREEMKCSRWRIRVVWS
ncbi:hypothetical protein [Bacillus cereus]